MAFAKVLVRDLVLFGHFLQPKNVVCKTQWPISNKQKRKSKYGFNKAKSVQMDYTIINHVLKKKTELTKHTHTGACRRTCAFKISDSEI